MNSTAVQTAIAALEKMINKALHYDPASANKMRSLSGTVLCLNSSKPSWQIFFFPLEDGCHMQTHYEGDVDVTVSGASKDLLNLAITPGHSLANTEVSASGKIGILSEYQDIFSQLDIDWEAALADKLGSIPANTLAQALRGGAKQFTQSADKVKALLPELMTEEWQLTPSRNEFDYFSHDVGELRSNADRLSAKIRQLRNTLDASNH